MVSTLCARTGMRRCDAAQAAATESVTRRLSSLSGAGEVTLEGLAAGEELSAAATLEVRALAWRVCSQSYRRCGARRSAALLTLTVRS